MACAERLPARPTATIGRIVVQFADTPGQFAEWNEDRAEDMAEWSGKFVKLAHIEDLNFRGALF